MTHQTPPPSRFLSIREVQQLTSLSRATIYRGATRGSLPAPTKLTACGGRVGFKESEIVEWLRDPLGWGQLSGGRE